tara:strand:+ start:329 stop:562 length:234 start_codon:yes stop_codon:yes gene_type:complete
MSQKKSYMNTENILSEGWFDGIKKGLSKLALKRDEKKAWKKAEKSISAAEKSLEAYAKSLGKDLEDSDFSKMLKYKP